MFQSKKEKSHIGKRNSCLKKWYDFSRTIIEKAEHLWDRSVLWQRRWVYSDGPRLVSLGDQFPPTSWPLPKRGADNEYQ